MEYKESKVTLIGSTKSHIDIDSDWFPVAAARVSHGADGKTGVDPEKDTKLMEFLSEHNHNTPFEHTSATFKIECPLFVRSEWHRHRTQAYNEISMRYTSSNIGKVFKSKTWRKQADRNKQSSEGQLDAEATKYADGILEHTYKIALDSYENLLEIGVAREQARMVIPVGHMTEFYASANLLNWAKFCRLRCAKDAQVEIRELAEEVNKILLNLYPNSWKILTKDLTNG